jgi:hypothetical protein
VSLVTLSYGPDHFAVSIVTGIAPICRPAVSRAICAARQLIVGPGRPAAAAFVSLVTLRRGPDHWPDANCAYYHINRWARAARPALPGDALPAAGTAPTRWPFTSAHLPSQWVAGDVLTINLCVRVKVVRRMAWRVMILKTISAMFSHEDPAGLVNLRFVQLTVSTFQRATSGPFGRSGTLGTIAKPKSKIGAFCVI